MSKDQIKLDIDNVNVFYGKKQALFNINLDIEENQVTALISRMGRPKGLDRLIPLGKRVFNL